MECTSKRLILGIFSLLFPCVFERGTCVTVCLCICVCWGSVATTWTGFLAPTPSSSTTQLSDDVNPCWVVGESMGGGSLMARVVLISVLLPVQGQPEHVRQFLRKNKVCTCVKRKTYLIKKIVGPR